MLDLGRRLKKLREDKHVSMDKMCDDLANIYNVRLAKSTISKWENGKAEPTLAYAKILSKYFNVTLDYLIGIEDVTKDDDLTIAAHHATNDWTQEELDEIERFKEFVKSRRK